MAEINTSAIDAIFVRSDTTAATSADQIPTLLSADFSGDASYTEVQYHGQLYKTRFLTGLDVSGSFSGKADGGGTVLAILESASTSGNSVQVTVLTNPAAALGQPKSTRYAMKVTSFSRSYPEAGLAEFSCSVVGDGAAPVVINAV